MVKHKFNVAMVSLGCHKNTVDAEKILGQLRKSGACITPDPKEADAIIVNTCGFLESARLEAIDNAGHFPTLSQPDAVNAALRRWLLE